MKIHFQIFLILFSIDADIIAFVEGKIKDYNEAHFLHSNLCLKNENAIEYGKSIEWQKLNEYYDKELEDDKIEDIFEWHIRYGSIRKFLKYCEFLETCIMHEKQELFKNEFHFIALKPNFFHSNGDSISIYDAMLLLVKTQKKIMLRKRKNLKALAEKAFSDSHFINRDNCIKVFTLAYCYKNNGHCENGEMGTKNLEKVKGHLLCRTTEIMDIDFPEPFKTIFENGSKCHPSTSGSGGDRHKNKERNNGIENLIGKLMQNMCLNVNGKKKDNGKKHNGTEKAEDDVEEEEEENEEEKGREFHPSSSSSSKSKPKHVRHNSIDEIIDTLVKYHRICDMNKRKKKKNKKGKAKKEELLMGGEGGSEEEEEEESEEDEKADDRCFGCFH